MSSGQSRAIGLLIVVVLLLAGLWSIGTLITPAGGDPDRPLARLACVMPP